MATKQIPHFDNVIDMEIGPEDKLAGDEAQIERDIAAEFGADGESEWIVTVKMINPMTKKQETCFKMSPGELPGLFERLKEEFGPGEYRAYVTKNGTMIRNLGYHIARPRAAPVAAPQASQLSDLGRILERQTEMIANLVRGNPVATAPVDPLKQMETMISVMLQMKQLTDAPKPANGMKETLEMLTVAKELIGDNSGGGKGVVDLLSDLVKSPIAGEIADQFRAERRRGPGTSPPSGPMPGPSAGTLIARPIPAAPGPANPTPAREAAPAQTVPALLAALDPPMTAQLKQQVDYWVTRAARDSDPALYVDLLFDNMDRAIIQGLIAHPELRPSLIYLNPQVVQYAAWFDEFLTIVFDMLTGMEDGDINHDEAIEAPDVSRGEIDPTTFHSNGNSRRSGGRPGDLGNHESLDE